MRRRVIGVVAAVATVLALGALVEADVATPGPHGAPVTVHLAASAPHLVRAAATVARVHHGLLPGTVAVVLLALSAVVMDSRTTRVGRRPAEGVQPRAPPFLLPRA